MDQVFGSLLVSGGPFAAQSYSDSEGGGWLLWLLGPALGVGFYVMMFLRYRNTDKRHAYERETSSEVVDLRVYDQVVGNVTGVQRSRIEGANGGSPRERLGQGTTVTVAAPVSPTEPSPVPPTESSSAGHQAEPPPAAQQAPPPGQPPPGQPPGPPAPPTDPPAQPTTPPAPAQ